jgi:hypothetical protein
VTNQDKECTAVTQTTTEPQQPAIPQVARITNSDNSITTTETQNSNINDNNDGQPNSSGGSSSNTSNFDSTNSENEDEFTDRHHKGDLRPTDHFVIMPQDKGVGLYRIVSDETELDTGILPQTIRFVQTFDDSADALAWLVDYDDSRN